MTQASSLTQLCKGHKRVFSVCLSCAPWPQPRLGAACTAGSGGAAVKDWTARLVLPSLAIPSWLLHSQVSYSSRLGQRSSDTLCPKPLYGRERKPWRQVFPEYQLFPLSWLSSPSSLSSSHPSPLAAGAFYSSSLNCQMPPHTA